MPIVRVGSVVAPVTSCWVLVPMMRAVAEGARETEVPDIVIAPPGVRVCEPILY